METEPLPPSSEREGPEEPLPSGEVELPGETWIEQKMEGLGESLDALMSTETTKEATEGPAARVQNGLFKIWGATQSTLGLAIFGSTFHGITQTRPENTAAMLGVALFATGVLIIQKAWVDSMKAKGYIKE